MTLCSLRVTASTLYVNINGTNPMPPYTTWATAATNIQNAVDVANPGDLILVTNGVYEAGSKQASDGTTNRVAVTNVVTLQSVNGAAATLIDGGGIMRCIYLTNGAVLSGFTLTNGSAGSGGGVYCTSTNVLISNCTIISNTASGGGGGVYSGTLTNCAISGNTCLPTGSNGGGASGSLLYSCTLTGNVTGVFLRSGATRGGGANSCTLNNCTLSGNKAYGAGAAGGAANSSFLNNCTLKNNYSDDLGGGTYISTLTNCLLYANQATRGGGDTSGTLNNCTICNNLSAGSGGGGTSGSTANNCIIFNNTSPNNIGSALNYCCTPDTGNAGCITNAPLFLNQSGGDFHLQNFSPCINAGNNAYAGIINDLDGNPRIVGGTVDIGAFENQSATAASGLPPIPSGLTAVVQAGSVILYWPPALKATGYNIYRTVTSGGSYTDIASVSITNYNDMGVVNGGTYFYFVTATNAYGQTVGSPQAIAYLVDHFAFAPIPSPQTSSVPFTVTISACDSDGNVLNNFTGGAMLTGAGDHGNIPLTPSSAAAFFNGQWTGSINLDPEYPDTDIRLTASSNNVSGTSSAFNAVAPAIQLFNLTASDLVYSPFAQKIYATVPASGGTLSNCLVTIDPVMGRVANSNYLGNSPGKLALSGDGQFLYVGFSGTNAFGRFNLGANALDFMASVGMDTYYGLPYYVNQFAVLPGEPHSVAMAVSSGFGDAAQVLIFDDGVERSNTFGGLYNYSGTVAAASDTRLYAGAPFTRLDVDQTGVTNSDAHDGLMGLSDLIKYQGGFIFTPGGNVFNPETLVVSGTLTNCSILEPDLAAGAIYAMGSHPVFAQPDAWTLYAWSPTNLQMFASMPVPGVLNGPSSLIRWGTNGLAFCAGNQLFLIRTSLVPIVPAVLTGGSFQPGGLFQLNFIGDPAAPYTMWGSSNLVNWNPLGPPDLISNSGFFFWDTNATSYPNRFYRVSEGQ